jgi:hypothetical protein
MRILTPCEVSSCCLALTTAAYKVGILDWMLLYPVVQTSSQAVGGTEVDRPLSPGVVTQR